MGRASYAVIEYGERWAILHDGSMEGDYDTKEAAFEAGVSGGFSCRARGA